MTKNTAPDPTAARFSSLEIDLAPKKDPLAASTVKEEYTHLVGHYALGKCRTLGSVIEEVAAAVPAKSDRVVRVSDIVFDEDARLCGMPVTTRGIQRTSRLTGVPKPMIDYLLAHDDAASLVPHLNREFRAIEARKPEKEYLLRLIEEGGSPKVRAIFSDQYQVIDNHQVVEMLAKALPGDPRDLLVNRFTDGEELLTGTLFLPDRMIGVDGDSDYGYGIAFKNSEVGRSSAQIKPFVFRSACLNGLVYGRQNSAVNVRQMHWGNVDLDELQDQITVAVQTAIGHGETIVKQIQATKEAAVEDPRKMIVLLADRYDLSREVARNWYDAYRVEPYENGFGILNGLTRAAQGYDGPAREELETAAATMLSPTLEADLRQIIGRWERFEHQAREVAEEEVVRVLNLR